MVSKCELRNGDKISSTSVCHLPPSMTRLMRATERAEDKSLFPSHLNYSRTHPAPKCRHDNFTGTQYFHIFKVLSLHFLILYMQGKEIHDQVLYFVTLVCRCCRKNTL